jgi:diaminopropionate ammonia-lyase
MTFVTATDGNHGRAVAWSAKHFGCKAVVYMPEGSSDFRLQAIQQLHADAEITNVNYDDTVKYAESQALTNNWILLQDSSWPGYVDVAEHIMMGYTTMVEEFIEQTSDWPTHVIAQAGVGSFAAAMFTWFSQTDKPKPKLILLEPSGAACFFNSIKVGDGQPHLTQELNTIMAGLSCGLPSVLAWNIITQLTDIFAICDDQLAIKGMRLFAHPNQGDPLIVSGESGAVPLGFIHEICSNENYAPIKGLLEIDYSSRVVMFSTEGDTDPNLYAKTIL